jgi:DNA-binding NarL/FixJ family response regulator
MSLLRVYLIEDSPIIRANLIDTLEELAPIKVVGSAESEDDAVEWMGTHTQDWDMLIIDIFLKSGSGMSVLRRMKERGERRKAVVFSNYATSDIKRRCIELGADEVYDKSNEIDALIAYCSGLGYAASGPGILTESGPS